MTEPCYWRLEFAAGNVYDEPEEGISILLVREGAERLIITRPYGLTRLAVVAVDLRHDGHYWRPVFYRRRSQSPGEQSRLDGTVFGRGREVADGRIESTLWYLARSAGVPSTANAFVSCPASMLDMRAVELAVSEPVGE